MTCSPVDAIKQLAEIEDVDRLRTATDIMNTMLKHMERVGNRREFLACDVQRLGKMLIIADSVGPEPAYGLDYSKKSPKIMEAGS